MSVNPYIDWWDKPDLFVNVSGKHMNKLSVKFEVGQHPKIKAEFSIKRFLETLSNENLNTLIKLCEDRLKCLKK